VEWSVFFSLSPQPARHFINPYFNRISKNRYNCPTKAATSAGRRAQQGGHMVAVSCHVSPVYVWTSFEWPAYFVASEIKTRGGLYLISTPGGDDNPPSRLFGKMRGTTTGGLT